MINLFTTDSYFNLFPILVDLIKEKGKGIEKKNVVFCEEKVSLMAERAICSEMGGSFNTEVYSFGNFLRVKKPMQNLLTKEGSAMVVKNILSTATLKCFKASKLSLAPTLYELIMQLKSARVTPENIDYASNAVSGVLKNKLEDLARVYSDYERFVFERGLEDQSSALNYLPEVIENEEGISNADVFIVGFTGFTAQLRMAIEVLIKKAKSVTFILCEGKNPMIFVNETAEFVRGFCLKNSYPLMEKKVSTDYTSEGRIITDGLFTPVQKGSTSVCETEKIFLHGAPNPIKEAQMIAETIKTAVINGKCRYRDVAVAVPDFNEYREYIKSAFETLDIPYFIDERKKPISHPLILLITAYIDVFRKNFERKAVMAFVKNPLFSDDKKANDAFINYVIKYNVNYKKFKEPFLLADEKENLEQVETLRKNFALLFNSFSVKDMLVTLSVKEKVELFTEKLKEMGEIEESAVNAQIFDAVMKILDQMDVLLKGVRLSLTEYKNVFMGGVSALELSIIPQYNDAVFIGDHKAVALAKAKDLFVIGLTSAVPSVSADIALLSDREIDVLNEIKVLVEPKIKVVNHRLRENVGLALSAFSEKLYLTYPIYAVDGKKNAKSEILSFIESRFKCNALPEENGYLTFKQGLKTFSKECGEFAEGKRNDFVKASSFFLVAGDNLVKDLSMRANKEIKVALDECREILIDKVTSPTAIEDYYKCPYYSFLSHGLSIKPREEGRMDGLSVGNLMHEIFSHYAKHLDEVFDKQSSDLIFEKLKDEILQRNEYKKFLSESNTAYSLKRALSECKKYCYYTYVSLKNSSFKVAKTEVPFGDGKDYPAVSLLGGKVKLKGKIDRVDESENYFRVVDYKTGAVDCSDKLLFTGIKLQLYLYTTAVMAKYQKENKKPAGLYYLPVSDKYERDDEDKKPLVAGKTLSDTDAVVAQDNTALTQNKSEFLPVSFNKDGSVKNANSADEIDAFIKYAVALSDLAVKRLTEGVIVPSPYKDTCTYCAFKPLCASQGTLERSAGKIDGETFKNALRGDE